MSDESFSGRLPLYPCGHVAASVRRKRAPGREDPRARGTRMPSTGHVCLQPGTYRNECHGREITLKRGDRFPPCEDCRDRARWTLTQVLLHATAMRLRAHSV
jgi:hypothetical protein